MREFNLKVVFVLGWETVGGFTLSTFVVDINITIRNWETEAETSGVYWSLLIFRD